MKAILLSGGIALLISCSARHCHQRVVAAWAAGEVRDDGPTSHHVKRGTPTMGGLVIILASVAGYVAKLFTGTPHRVGAVALLFLFVGLGIVGVPRRLLSDRAPTQDLRSRAKMIGQTVVALVFGWLALSYLGRREPPGPRRRRHLVPARHFRGWPCRPRWRSC